MELRIGNLVMDKHGNIIEVEEIQADRINCFEGDPEFQTLLEDVYPIDIQSFALFLFGFSKSDNQEYTSYKKGRFEVIIEKKMGTCLYMVGDNEHIKIDSVHKLQNLYGFIVGDYLLMSDFEFQQEFEKHKVKRIIALNKSKQN